MYKCDQCQSVFTVKRNYLRHVKAHSGERFLCTVCPSSFSYNHSLVKHTKKFHPAVNVIAHRQPAAPIVEQRVINFTPSIVQPTTQEYIQVAPQIFVPDAPAGGSNIISNDDLCMAAMDKLESQDLADAVNECKERWRKIRDTYMKSKKKLGTGSENAINNLWPLAFLDKVKSERSTITNVSPFSPSVDEMLADDDDVNENEDIKPYFKTNVQSTKDDDVDLFFRSIAKTVKKFPKKGVSETKLKVLTIVLEFEEKYDGPNISGSAYSPAYSPHGNPPNPIPSSNLFTTYNFDAYTQVPEPQEFLNFAPYDN